MGEVVPCRITEKVKENHNTIRIKVEPNAGFINSRPCSFVYIYSDVDNQIRRPYTYLNAHEDPLEFLIKIYDGENGVSRYIGTLNKGDRVFISPPLQKIEYVPGLFRSVLMIAGGTGIAPMIQVLNAERFGGGSTRFTLLFCNSTKRDIIGMNEMSIHKDRLDVIHVISSLEDESESFIRGRISIDMLRRFSSKERNGMFDFVFVCGKPEMLRDVCGGKAKDKSQGEVEGMLHELGYCPANVYKF